MRLVIAAFPERSGTLAVMDGDKMIHEESAYVPEIMMKTRVILKSYPEIENIYIAQIAGVSFLNMIIDKLRAITDKPIIIGAETND